MGRNHAQDLTALVVAAVAFAAQSMGAKDEVTQSKYEALFDALWTKVDQNFCDPHFHGVDWRAAGTRYREKLPRVHSDAEFERLATAMLDGLHASHTYIRPPQNRRPPAPVLACAFTRLREGTS